MKLLIAAGRAAPSAEALPPAIGALIDEADEIVVVAPSLPGRFEWLVSDTDKARERADERLGAVLGQLDELGAEVQGNVGSDDPLEAFGDAMREFGADHILVAMRGADQADWQERGLLDELVARFRVPLTVFQV